jgi:hypothetical protein
VAYAFGRTMVTDPPYGVNYDPAFSLTGFDIRRCDEFELGELFAERTQGRTDPQMRSHGRQFLYSIKKEGDSCILKGTPASFRLKTARSTISR